MVAEVLPMIVQTSLTKTPERAESVVLKTPNQECMRMTALICLV